MKDEYHREIKRLEEKFEAEKLILKEEHMGEEEVEEKCVGKEKGMEEDSDDDFVEEGWSLERNMERS